MNRLLAVGLAIMAFGVALVVLGSVPQGSVSAGGFILIGPFPIVFGTGPDGGQLATLALALGLVMALLLSLLAWRLAKSARGNSAGNV